MKAGSSRQVVGIKRLAIRMAGSSDLGGIAAIYNDAIVNTKATFDTEPKGPREMRRWLRDHRPTHPVVVAEEGGKVVGWASLSRWSERKAYARTVELSVYVGRGHRGKGIGRRLLKRVLAEGRRAGFREVVSRIVEGSEASLRLHERQGFVLVGVMKRAGRKFGRLLDVHIMQKSL